MTASEHSQPEIKHVTMTKSGEGWELRAEEGAHVVRAAKYTDWHRVERALELFKRRGYQVDGYASTNR